MNYEKPFEQMMLGKLVSHIREKNKLEPFTKLNKNRLTTLRQDPTGNTENKALALHMSFTTGTS